MSKEFPGEIKSIKPHRLINKTKEESIETFFLTLAVIFNDIKGLMFFHITLMNDYRTPKADEVSPHAGERGGLVIQIHKLIASTVREFLEFIKENATVLALCEFDLLLQALPEDFKNRWNEMVTIAMGKSSNSSEFSRVLQQIRHNISFHYYGAGPNLRKGFIDCFLTDSPLPQRESALYSIGDKMETTRFYYADAALEQYIATTTNKAAGDTRQTDPAFAPDYLKSLAQMLDSMNAVIARLLKEYLRSRPH